jgi:hypothetical protein
MDQSAVALPNRSATSSVTNVPALPRAPRDRPAKIDPRPLRLEQAIVGVLLLAGFAFRAELVIPITTVLLAISGAIGPEREPIARLLATGLTERAHLPPELVDRQTLRLAVLVETALLLVASLVGFIGLEPLAWLVALTVAALALYDATTGAWISARLYWRFARRNRP